jgi:hypothetical protein
LSASAIAPSSASDAVTLRQYLTRRLVELSRAGPIIPGKCHAMLGDLPLDGNVSVERQEERLVLRVTFKNTTNHGVTLKTGQQLPVRLDADKRELFRFRIGAAVRLDAGGTIQIEGEWP